MSKIGKEIKDMTRQLTERPPRPSSSPELQTLAKMTAKYHEHNKEKAEKLGDHVQACTIADLELIVRETRHEIERMKRRLERLEQRLGMIED